MRPSVHAIAPVDPDSTLTLTFVETHEGARIELVQTGVPDDAVDIIDAGWHEIYWKPWRAYLNANA